MNSLKRFLSLLLCCCLVVGVIPAQASAEGMTLQATAENIEETAADDPTFEEKVITATEQIQVELEGTPAMMAAGENLTWVLDSNGKLTINGTGAMSYEIPWKAYNASITEVVICFRGRHCQDHRCRSICGL